MVKNYRATVEGCIELLGLSPTKRAKVVLFADEQEEVSRNSSNRPIGRKPSQAVQDAQAKIWANYIISKLASSNRTKESRQSVYDEIESYCESHPHIRVGQLLMNALMDGDLLFYAEDDSIVKSIESFYTKFNK